MLPRFKLANIESSFSLFFTLIDMGYVEIFDSVLMNLSVNQRIFNNLLNCSNLETLKDESISPYKLLYHLKIMEFFFRMEKYYGECKLKIFTERFKFTRIQIHEVNSSWR
jgi:hypothetical protein